MAALRSDDAAQEDTAAVTAHTLEVPSSAAALWLSPPPQDLSLRFRVLEKGRIIVGGRFWATLASACCAREHEIADGDWFTVFKNRNEWPADLDWLQVQALMDRQQQDEHGRINYRIDKYCDPQRGEAARYYFPTDDRPVHPHAKVVARLLHVWEAAGTAEECDRSRQFVIAAGSHLLLIVKGRHFWQPSISSSVTAPAPARLCKACVRLDARFTYLSSRVVPLSLRPWAGERKR